MDKETRRGRRCADKDGTPDKQDDNKEESPPTFPHGSGRGAEQMTDGSFLHSVKHQNQIAKCM